MYIDVVLDVGVVVVFFVFIRLFEHLWFEGVIKHNLKTVIYITTLPFTSALYDLVLLTGPSNLYAVLKLHLSVRSSKFYH